MTDRALKDLLVSAKANLVGGCMGMFRMPDEVATVFHHGSGSRIFDVTGREYIDYVLGSGPLILGHAHPAVVHAVQQQVARGSTFFGLNEPVIRLAERIVKASPCAERVRFVSSGTEGTFAALRMTRAFTGREMVLKFEGGWHGAHDYAQQSAASDRAADIPSPVTDSGGIPSGATRTVLVAPFNDPDTACDLMRAHADELAAVIVEPLQRAIKPDPGFLQALREATAARGICLIFDEVVTGFRIAWGGAQERYGVVPDVAVFGKTISGGFPLAAVAGRADILDCADPGRKSEPDYAFVSGTANGNPIGTTAGLATLDELEKPGVYDHLHALPERLRAGLETLGREMGLPVSVIGDGPVLQTFFTEGPLSTYADSLKADAGAARAFGIEMIREGIFVNPGGKLYLSLAHTEADVDRTLEAARRSLQTMASRAKASRTGGQ